MDMYNMLENMDSGECAIIVVCPESSGNLLRERISEKGYSIICIYLTTEKEWNTLFENGCMSSPCLEQLREDYDWVLFEPDISIAINKIKESTYNIKAVIPGSEKGVDYSDIIGFSFRLPCNSPETIMARRDKSVMKEYAAEAGIKCADFQRCYFFSDVENYMKTKAFPVVVKTPLGAASHMVYVCREYKDLKEKYLWPKS